MKEYKIWKFNKSGYLQTVTISLEEEYPCKQKKDVDIPVQEIKQNTYVLLK